MRVEVKAAPADTLAVTRAGQKGIMVAITLVPFAAVIAAITNALASLLESLGGTVVTGGTLGAIVALVIFQVFST